MLNNPLEIQTIITIQYFYRTTMITNYSLLIVCVWNLRLMRIHLRVTQDGFKSGFKFGR